MNIGFYKRPKIATLLTTIYFSGILASSGLMYIDAVEVYYTVIGTTFFSGIVAIYFTARSKEEVVVYLDKKEERVITKVSNDDSQLNGIAMNGSDPQETLNQICARLNAGQGAIYAEEEGELRMKYGYATADPASFKAGEGLVGRVAVEKKSLYIDQLPEGYITVFSGLGNASPRKLALIPINNGVIELATFSDITPTTLKHIEESCSQILR